MAQSILNLFALSSALLLGVAAARAAPPPNDLCAEATPVTIGGTVTGTCAGATPDGDSSCAGEPAGDVYHTFTTTLAGVYTLSLCSGTTWDTVLSVHSACPATQLNEIICDDDGCQAGSAGPTFSSTLRVYLPAGSFFLIRIAAFDGATATGPYALTVTGPAEKLGACCRPAGCTISTLSACTINAGQYAGDLTACILTSGTPQNFADTMPLPLDIPDHDPIGLSRTITVPPAALTIGDVRVNIQITHGCVGNLTMRLTHGAASATLIQHVGVGELGSDATLHGSFTFSDTAPVTIWPYAPTPASGHPVPSGAYICTDADANCLSLRQAFAGSDASGDWTLKIIDDYPGYTGQLESWSIQIDPAGPSVCNSLQGACCPAAGCTSTTAAVCMSTGGTFHGAGTTCTVGPNNPVACCPANFNRLNGLDVGDIFGFLLAWFNNQQPADFNNDGAVQIHDLFAFLSAWFAGC